MSPTYRYRIEWLDGKVEELKSEEPAPDFVPGGFSIHDHLGEVHYFNGAVIRRTRVQQMQQAAG